MYSFQNLLNTGRYFSNKYINNIEIFNLCKHDSISKTARGVPINIMLFSGNLMINFNNKKQYDTSQESTLYAESELLYKSEMDHDIVLTNCKHIITVKPHVNFSLYSLQNNTNFQIFDKSDDYIKYHTFKYPKKSKL